MQKNILFFENEELNTYICEACDGILEKMADKCPLCGESGSVKKIEIIPKNFDDEFSLFENDETESEDVMPVSAARIYDETQNESAGSSIKSYKTGISEFDKLFDGALLSGTVNLFIGAPGAGKTLFLLKIAEAYAKSGLSTLFISSEESLSQLSSKISKLSINSPKFYFVSILDIRQAMNEISKFSPEVLILDSVSGFFKKDIDAVQSTHIQIRECMGLITQMAKEDNRAVLISAQNLYSACSYEFDSISSFFDSIVIFNSQKDDIKTLKLKKSRSSANNSIGIFKSNISGLIPLTSGELLDFSKLDRGRFDSQVGRIFFAANENGLNTLVEIHVLVCKTDAVNPKHKLDPKISGDMFETVINIIEKYENIDLQNCNINVKIKSSFYVNDEAIELALAAGIISSYYNIALPSDLIIGGHVELTGKVAADNALLEKICVISAENLRPIILSGAGDDENAEALKNMELINIKSIDQLKKILSAISKK